jgi:hypothetical protein
MRERTGLGGTKNRSGTFTIARNVIAHVREQAEQFFARAWGKAINTE